MTEGAAMKLPSKTVIILISIPIVILLFFSSNIYGYFRFKSYCSNEGGLRVYEKLERNVGWWAKDKYAAMETSSLDGVGFVRFTGLENKDYDLLVEGNRDSLNPNYHIEDSNDSKVVIYRLDIEKSKTVVYEPSSVTYKTVRIRDDKIMSEFKVFYYSFFNSDRTPLNANQRFSCYAEFDRTNFFQDWIKGINNSFK